jgi:hypothetical protein
VRPSRWTTAGILSSMQAMLVLLVACNEGPTDAVPLADKGSATVVTGEIAEKPKRKDLTLHYARVAKDGTLIDGTAVAATRPFGEGNFFVTFDVPINECAGTASPAALGRSPAPSILDQPVIVVLENIGRPTDPNTVHVVTRLSTDGSLWDTHFNLILVCP